MCFNCQRRWQKDLKESMVQANEHMDAEGVPEDSLVRGVVQVQLACQQNPILSLLMQEMYPGVETLVQ